MSHFVHIDYPARHPGVARIERAVRLFRKAHPFQFVVQALAAIGSPFRRGYDSWAEARRQAREDDKLWNLALTDARVMADLSRAMSRDALRDTRAYY